jgi:hypothetical protein
VTPSAAQTQKAKEAAAQQPAQQPAELAQLSILPTDKTKPTLSAETAKGLLYGPPKIGKTETIANLDPDHTLMLATEAGYGALEAFVKPVGSWTEFRAVGPELKKGGHPFTTLAVDTVDELFKFCTDQVMKDLKITHPSDLDYGKGWAAVTDEFRLRVGALCSLGLGVWFISHSVDRDVKTRTGGELTVTSPSLSGKAREWLLGFVDYILYARSEVGEEGETRVVRTVATENYVAGGRVVLPDPLPLNAAAIKGAISEAVGARHAAAEPAETEQKAA